MPDTHLLAVWLVGFLGGGHCVGMCGGLASALMMQLPPQRRAWPYLLAVNGGRLLSYTAVGALVGGIGGLGIASLNSLGVQWGLFFFAQSLLFFLGLYLAGINGWVGHIERLGRPIWRRLQPLLQTILPIRHLGHAVIAGALWGWLPCGLVYTASLSALATASPQQGALLMLAFGLGTLPNLLLIGWFADSLRHTLQKTWVRRVAGLSICLLALWQLVSALQHPHLF